VEEYETLLEVYEQHLRRRETEAALATVRAEGGEPTPDVISDVERAVEGEIAYDEAKERVLARARQWNKTPTATPEPPCSGTGSASRNRTPSKESKSDLSSLNLRRLMGEPLPGDYDLAHLQRFHNGRAERAFVGQLARDAGYRVAWERMSGARNDAVSAASLAQGDQGPLRVMLGDLVE
jgi:hypothetical protein